MGLRSYLSVAHISRTKRMGTLSGLVKAIAVVQGLDENQVLWIARYLREAGLITQGGRGRGGARMTVSDAANLLIGVNAPGAPKDSAALVQAFRDLDLTFDALSDPDPDEWDASSEEVFRRGSPFGPALEHVIADFIKSGTYPVSEELTRVTLSGPLLNASIFCGAPDAERAGDVSISVQFSTDEMPGKNFPDQYVSKSFTDRTLSAVGQILAT